MVNKLKGKFDFKFSIGESGNLEDLLEVKDNRGILVGSDQFDPKITRFLRARIQNFNYDDGALGLHSYKKIRELGTQRGYSPEDSPSVTLSYKIGHINLD